MAGLAGDAEGESGPAVDQAGGEADPGLVEGAAPGFLLDPESALRAGDVGDDVQGAADRGDGEVRGPQPALHLDRRGGVPEAVEVGPVDPAVLHVVDGHAVDHDGDVALVEPPEVDAGIAGAAALPGGVHAGRVVQDQWQVPGAELAVHLLPGNVREGDRRLPQSGPVGHDDDLLAQKDLGHQLDEQLDVAGPDEDRAAELLVPDEARHQGIAAGGDAADLELPVGTGGGAPVRVLQVDVRAWQGVTGLRVEHSSLQHGRGQGGVGEQQQGESEEDPFHQEPRRRRTAAHQRGAHGRRRKVVRLHGPENASRRSRSRSATLPRRPGGSKSRRRTALRRRTRSPRHLLRGRVVRVLELVAVGGAAHDDAVDRRVETELHGQVLDVHVPLAAPLPHGVGPRLGGPVRLGAGEAAHAEDAGQDQAGAVFPGQGHGGAGNGLVQQCVVEEGEDDLGVSRLDGGAVEVVLADPQADVAHEALLLHPLQLVEGAARAQRVGDVGRVVDEDGIEIVDAQRPQALLDAPARRLGREVLGALVVGADLGLHVVARPLDAAQRPAPALLVAAGVAVEVVYPQVEGALDGGDRLALLDVADEGRAHAEGPGPHAGVAHPAARKLAHALATPGEMCDEPPSGAARSESC